MLKEVMWVGAMAAAALLAGCAESRVATDYGTYHKLAKFNQILEPRAERNLEPVSGQDGEVVARTIEKYHKSFEKVEQGPTFIVNVGKTGR
jgi:major membrane immunogen (membrane-anchored lipoprotein)